MATYLYDKILPPRAKQIVIFDYTPRCVGELNVLAGDEVLVKNTIDWWAEAETKDGQVGYIPKTYLALPNTMEANMWFFPEMSRAEAEEILILQDPGTYLVRPSTNEIEFSLSLRTKIPERSIVHYKIGYNAKQGYHIHDNLFAGSLPALIGYYQRDTSNELQMRHALTQICPKTAPRIFSLAPHNKPIPHKEITTQALVGRGHWGEVYSGYYHQFKIAVKAAKIYDKQLWEKEMKPLRELCHKNVVTFYGYCSEQKWLIFEFVDYCLLNQLKNRAYRNNPQQLLQIATQVARGMRYVHSMKYVHRDLAARNVLITMDLQAKIADFGLSRKLKNGIYNMAQPGGGTPYKWEAIECLDSGTYNKTTDVWAFGVLMYEIYSEGTEPYKYCRNREWLLESLKTGHRLERPALMPERIYHFISTCWLKDSKKRPNFPHIYTFLLKSE